MLKTARRVVVGVDGSEESLAALRWAIGQDRLTNATVEVFYAFEEPPPVPYSPTIRGPAGEFAEDAHTELDRVITYAGKISEDPPTAQGTFDPDDE